MSFLPHIRNRGALLIAMTLIAVTPIVTAAPAVADVASVTGKAVGASVAAPGTDNSLSAQPAVTFTNPSDGPGPFTATVAAVAAPSTGPIGGGPPGGFFNAQAMTVTTGQVGALGTHAGGSRSTADIGRAAYRSDDLIAMAVHSECSAAGAGSTASMTIGSVAFTDLADSTFKVFTNYSPAPNTTFKIFEGGTVVFNEQTVLGGPQTTGISIVAIHITFGASDIKVGFSQCTATGPDVVVPSGIVSTRLRVFRQPLSGPAPLTVTWTYTETNDGTVALSNVTLVDDVCAPVVFGSGDTNGNNILDPGEIWRYSCTTTYDEPGVYISAATATGSAAGKTHVEQGGDVVVEVDPPLPCDLKIVKELIPNPLIRGGSAVVRLTVTNVGTGACFGADLADPKVPGLTFTTLPVPSEAGWFCGLDKASGDASCTTAETLASGHTVTFTMGAFVTTGAPALISECAVIANDADVNLANNESCVDAPVKSIRSCDLQILKSMPAVVATGQNITFTIVVKNLSGVPCGSGASPTVVTDPKVAGLTITGPPTAPGWVCTLISGSVSCINPTTLPSGYVATFTITGVVTAKAPGMVTNCARVANADDPIAGNNLSCRPATVVADLRCDLVINKATIPAAPGPVFDGQKITVVITIRNLGAGPCGNANGGTANGATVVQDLHVPDLTLTKPKTGTGGWACQLAGLGDASCATTKTLQPLDTVTFTIGATVADPNLAPIVNCATVANPEDTVNTMNNTSCVTLSVLPANECDLQVVKTMNPGQLKSGMKAVVVIKVTNVGTGTCTASAVGKTMVQDVRPPELVFVSLPVPNGAGWFCGLSATTGDASCVNSSPLPPNYNVQFSMVVLVTAKKGSTVTNCAMIAGNNDINQANDTSCVTKSVT